VFSLRIPTFALRGRGDASGLDGRDAFVTAISAGGVLGSISVTLRDAADPEATPILGPIALSLLGETRAVTGRIIGPAGEEPLALELGRDAVAALLRTESGLRVWWIPRRDAAQAGEIHLEGARRGGIRLRDDTLLVFDDLGRIIGLDPTTGEMLRDARL
jgi:hypothetical protein